MQEEQTENGMSHNKTLRLILGDQLNSGHSWFCKTEPHMTYVLMEVRSETDYDVCSNWCNWAYVAGVGNDPRPNRYFNIQKQSEQYDGDRRYRDLWRAPVLAPG